MIIIKNGTLITPNGAQKADLLIKGRKIDEISQSIYYKSAEMFDATDCMVFAGFIDAHTHLGMEIEGIKTSDDFHTGTKAALVGGTTSVIDYAYQRKGEALEETFDKWQAQAKDKSYCDYSCHILLSDWNDNVKAELPKLIDSGVKSYKVFMANEKLAMTDKEIHEVLTETKKHGAITLAHCEDGKMVADLTKESIENGNTQPCFHHLSHPDFSEASAISRYCEIAKDADADVNIVHLSSSLGLTEALLARTRGQNVFIETCPHYLTLDESVYSLPDFEGAKYVCSPPIRTSEDRKALWSGISEDKINTVSTDHCSYNFEGQKTLGIDDFSKIPNGLPGIEHRASLIYTYGVLTGKITEHQMGKILSENIAKQFGMYPKKGALLVGSDADIVIWDGNESYIVTSQSMLQECDYTPYEGMELVGKPRAVFLKGELMFDGNAVVAQPIGEPLIRK